MDVLFIHPNFPGQFRGLASALCAKNDMRVYTLRDASRNQSLPDLPGATHWTYAPPAESSQEVHSYLRATDVGIRRGQTVARLLLEKKHQGFEPDVIYVHPAWGDALYLKDIFPDAYVIGLFEYFYQTRGADVGFDPEFPLEFDDIFRVRTMNTLQLLSLEACDLGLCATAWQRSRYPKAYQDRLQVLHEGIDTVGLAPKDGAVLEVEGASYTVGEHTIVSDHAVLRAGDEVLTYVSRSLEPYRGIHTFMRALPLILRERPNCHVLILGKDEPTYGPPPKTGAHWRDVLLAELIPRVDEAMLARVHFMGSVPYTQYLKVLAVSRVHVYLTYPFVLSWSMLEAMSMGCLVVGSRTAPVEEVIRHGENGLLVDFKDAGELAKTVNAALADPLPYAPLGRKARQDIIQGYDFAAQVLPEHLALLACQKRASETLAFLGDLPGNL